MTNREESEAAEHETYPGPGPLRADESKRGIHPVEQMVDAAIDRIAREREASRTGNGDLGDRDPGHALALAPKEGAASALVTTKRGSGKLRWKGLEVSDEFRSYAERVARGEDLPPYKGRILAEPDAAFPWEPAARKHAKRQARRLQTVLWGVGAALVGLASWSLVVQLGGEAEAWQRAGESALGTTVLSNQPAFNLPNLERTASAEAAPELPSAPATSPVQVSDPGEPISAATAGSTALVALTAPTRATGSASAAGAGERSAQPASEPAKPVAARDSLGVFVTTRAQSNEVQSSGVSPVANAASAAAASPSAAARSSGDSSSLSASSAAVTPSTAIGQADPKKEPSAEPSANGALLVETPSF